MRKPEEYQFTDYSQSDFIAWNREREMHLQTIDHLKSRVAELTAERGKHLSEIDLLGILLADAIRRNESNMLVDPNE